MADDGVDINGKVAIAGGFINSLFRKAGMTGGDPSLTIETIGKIKEIVGGCTAASKSMMDALKSSPLADNIPVIDQVIKGAVLGAPIKELNVDLEDVVFGSCIDAELGKQKPLATPAVKSGAAERQ